MVFLDVGVLHLKNDEGLMNISNVPIGAGVLLVLPMVLKINEVDNVNKRLPFKDKMWRLDPLGVLTFIGAICCLLLALQWGGQTLPWSSSKVIGLFVGFGLLMMAFCIIQWKRGETATIPFRVLRQRSILMGSCFLFFLGMTVYVVFLHNLIPFYTTNADSSFHFTFRSTFKL